MEVHPLTGSPGSERFQPWPMVTVLQPWSLGTSTVPSSSQMWLGPAPPAGEEVLKGSHGFLFSHKVQQGSGLSSCPRALLLHKITKLKLRWGRGGRGRSAQPGPQSPHSCPSYSWEGMGASYRHRLDLANLAAKAGSILLAQQPYRLLSLTRLFPIG